MPAGGQVVAETLAELGGETIFSVSGNQVLSIYDAAGEAGLRIIHMRHESASVYAAAAFAEVRGVPGIALTSAGPGFLASLTGAAVARSMELPLLLLSGAAPTTRRNSGAFQDLDQAAAARVACKLSWALESIADIPRILARAWQVATTGIPGPVHVSLPVDLLTGSADIALQIPEPIPTPDIPIDARTILAQMAERLQQARRPAIIARPSAARGGAGEALAALGATLGIPILVTGSPRGLSDLKYGDLIRKLPQADCILVVGPADFASGFLAEPLIAASADVLLIDAPDDPQPQRAIALRTQSPPSAALPYLASRLSESLTDSHWSLALNTPGSLPDAVDVDGELHPLTVAVAVREVLRPEDTLVLDGGEFCQWVRWGLRDVPNTLLWNGKLGAIGGSMGQAVGVAASGLPGRVIVVMGDGSAGYHLSEFETAARYGLPFVTIIGNDARWAAEWHQQVNRYGPERTFETELLPARYDIAATGYGADGSLATDAASLRAALAEHLASGRPACINTRVRAVQSPAFVE